MWEAIKIKEGESLVGLLHPWNVQGWVGWDLEKPGIVGSVGLDGIGWDWVGLKLLPIQTIPRFGDSKQNLAQEMTVRKSAQLPKDRSEEKTWDDPTGAFHGKKDFGQGMETGIVSPLSDRKSVV